MISCREQFLAWVSDIIPNSKLREKYLRENVASDYPTGTPDNDKRFNYLFCTNEHTYKISVTSTYLGCIATSNRRRPGESWNRGNDLPDGKFCLDTWLRIKDAILNYELVYLAEPNPALADGTCGLPPTANVVEAAIESTNNPTAKQADVDGYYLTDLITKTRAEVDEIMDKIGFEDYRYDGDAIIIDTWNLSPFCKVTTTIGVLDESKAVEKQSFFKTN